jgi:hypothetical protein
MSAGEDWRPGERLPLAAGHTSGQENFRPGYRGIGLPRRPPTEMSFIFRRLAAKLEVQAAPKHGCWPIVASNQDVFTGHCACVGL